MAKIISREWTTRGPLGRKLRHVAYGYDVTINGKRERRFDSAWTTDAEALEALLERQKAAEAGQGTRPAERTMGELAEEYLAYKTQHGKRSLKEDRRILTTRLLPTFGKELPVRRLTAPMIAQYEKRRVGQVSAFTVSNELSVLRHMLRLARRWGYLTAVPDLELPKKPQGRLRYLEEDEIGRLLKVCATSRNPYLAMLVMLALNTGMRKGEILALTWERVDLSSARITLYQTKSGKPRGVPVNRDVYEAMIALEPEAAQRQGLLFQRRDGAGWGQVRTAFATALKKAEIKGFRFHDLRHTFASHYMMRGGSLYDLREILGHGDIKMTMRYAHLSPQHLRAGVERVEGLARLAPMAQEMAQSAKIEPDRRVNPDAPVAQVDRAAVS
jgi:integrase